MAKQKEKMTAAQKRVRREAKAGRQKKYMWVFLNGKQVRVKRLPTIDGMEVDDFIRQNADPIWDKKYCPLLARWAQEQPDSPFPSGLPTRNIKELVVDEPDAQKLGKRDVYQLFKAADNLVMTETGSGDTILLKENTANDTLPKA